MRQPPTFDESDGPGGLPSLYARWTRDLLEGPIPRETEATCHNCAMCPATSDDGGGSLAFFNPATKCCTYYPVLPNYIVGQILADEDESAAPGRATVEARIRRGVMVTPLGLGMPPRYSLLYDHGTPGFGQSGSLLCPHYLPDGRCGIWRYRNAVCASWYCKHVRGAVGHRFWQSLQRLLSLVEGALSRWCVLLEGGVGSAVFEHLESRARQPAEAPKLTASDLDEESDPEASLRIWGPWAGREAEYFKRCARRVIALEWTDVLQIGGPEITALARLTRKAYDVLLDTSVPEGCVVGKLEVVRMDRSGTQVVTYSGTDPLRLSPELMNVLPLFDGRSTRDAVNAAAADYGLNIGEDLIRRLADFEILVPGQRP